ncbi:MAG: hypothetical protein D6736_07655, partial [Nitrospinota bacterium]
ELYEAYQELFNEETISLLQEALHQPETMEEALSPKLLSFLLEYVVEHFLNAAGWRHKDRLQRRQEQAKVVIPEVEEIPLTWIPFRLANEPKRHRREFLSTLAETVAAELHPYYRDYWQQMTSLAQALGYAHYAALWQEVGRLDLEGLQEQGARFLAETEDMYLDVLRWMLKKRVDCSLKEACRHDLLYLFRGAEFDRYFPPEEAMSILPTMARELYPEGEGGADILWEWRQDGKYPLSTACLPVEVPERVYLLVAPHGGWKDYQRLLQEYGKALYYTHIPATKPFPYQVLGDRSLWMSYAFLWASLTRQPSWIGKYLDWTQSEDYARLSTLEKLFIVRRHIAKLRYELTWHQEGGGEETAEAYVEYISEACRVRYPQAFYLAELESNLLPAWYLRAWFFEAGLRAYLQEQYGEEWYRDPAAGAWLHELWSLGQEYTLEELAALGYPSLRPDALIDDFLSRL